jgi:hypothetical protein
MKLITIVDIKWSDKNDSTHVCDVITLSDGSIIYAENGNASYEVYDTASGVVQIGAVLSSVEQQDWHGRYYMSYYFDTPTEVKLKAIIAAAPINCYHIKLRTPFEGHVVDLTNGCGDKPFDCARAAYGSGEISEEQLQRHIFNCDRVDYLVCY